MARIIRSLLIVGRVAAVEVSIGADGEVHGIVRRSNVRAELGVEPENKPERDCDDDSTESPTTQLKGSDSIPTPTAVPTAAPTAAPTAVPTPAPTPRAAKLMFWTGDENYADTAMGVDFRFGTDKAYTPLVRSGSFAKGSENVFTAIQTVQKGNSSQTVFLRSRGDDGLHIDWMAYQFAGESVCWVPESWRSVQPTSSKDSVWDDHVAWLDTPCETPSTYGYDPCAQEVEITMKQAAACTRGNLYPDPFPPCQEKIELAIVVDASGSIQSSGWDASVLTVREIIRRVRPSESGTRISLVIFSSWVKVHVPLTGSSTTLLNAINSYSFNGGSTATDLGLKEVREDMKKSARSGAKKVAVTITDGKPDSMQAMDTQGQALKDDGVRSVWLLVGANAPIDQARTWASTPIDAFQLKSYTKLDKTMVDSLMPSMCGKYNPSR